MSVHEDADYWRQLAARHDRFFWLDGDPSSGWAGTRSFYGWLRPEDVSLTFDAGKRVVTRHANGASTVVGSDIFEVLRHEMNSVNVPPYWFGYFGFGCHPHLPAQVGSTYPDAVWMAPSVVRVAATPPIALRNLNSQAFPATSYPSKCASDERVHQKWYHDAFESVREYLYAGDTYELNLTYNMVTPGALDPMAAYLDLRTTSPAPYSAYLQHRLQSHDVTLLSTSPERFLKVSADRTVSSKPMKGTTPRDPEPAIDQANSDALRSDPRFQSENLMVTDLVRSDLAAVCEVGSIHVPYLMKVESFAHVHQLVSEVTGTLRADVHVIDAVKALFPAGSMTGAPKRRTMEIISDLETAPRGAYAGVHGWISSDGSADLGVTIRTAVQDASLVIQVGTGGAITVNSTEASEREEAELKVSRLLASLSNTERRRQARKS